MEVKRNFKIIKEHIDNIKEINEEKGLLLFDDNKIEYCFLREDNKYILKRYIRENDKFVEGIEN